MSLPRFFATGPLPVDDAFAAPLSDTDLHHIRHVLRLRAGEQMEIVWEGSGWSVEVVELTADALIVTRVAPLSMTDGPQVTLVQGVAKGEKMDAIVRQAVEVGAAGVIPVLFSRSVVKLDAGKRSTKGERWRRIAKAAAEQSHRAVVPPVSDPVDFSRLLETLNDFGAVYVAWEEADGMSLHSAVSRDAAHTSNSPIAVVVGPEGGLSEEEVALMTESGSIPVSLGPSIMRTETAAVVAVALALQAIREPCGHDS